MMRLTRWRTPCTLLFALLAMVAPAAAETYTLATTVDDATVNGNCTLREAIRAATSNVAVDACTAGGAADTIILPAGAYPFGGGQEVITAAGALEIRSQTLDPALTIIDLQYANRFLAVGAGTGSLTLRAFSILHGQTTGGGGAIIGGDYDLTLDGMWLTGNSAGADGGAVSFSSTAAGSLLITDAAFGYNSGRSGGGVEAHADNPGAAVVLRDVSFAYNTATASSGDARGGGLLLSTVGAGAVASCVRCTFYTNSVTNTGLSSGDSARGGGAYVWASEGASARLVDAELVDSTASATGTEVPALSAYAATGGMAELDRVFVDLSHSTDPLAYGASLVANTLGYVSLTDAQISTGSTNGLWAYAYLGVVDLGQLTIADYSGVGASLHGVTWGHVELQNSLLALNATDLVVDGSVSQTGNCVAMGGTFPGFVSEWFGDFRLAAGSAAIDAGVDDQPLERFADRDHGARVVGAHPDCGAYEYGGLFVDDFEVGDTGSWSAASR